MTWITLKKYCEDTGETPNAVRDRISKNTFDYSEFFPDSPRRFLFIRGKSTRTVKNIGLDWLADMKRSKPHSTYRAYSYPTENVIFPAIGDKRIRDVTAHDLRKMLRDLNIGPKTLSNYTLPLRAIFDRAMTDEDIERNPLDRINMRDLVSHDKQKSKYVVDPLEPAEIMKFLAACKKHRPQWLHYWTVAIYTGMRTSELFGLEWHDWKGDKLTITRAVVYGEEKETKTETSDRTILLVPAARAALKAQKDLTAFHTRVFWNPNTKGELSYKIAQSACDYISGKAGIRRRQAYQTRHTFASNLLSTGENPLFVAKQMGHKNTAVLFKRYAKWVNAENYVPVSDFGESENAT